MSAEKLSKQLITKARSAQTDDEVVAAIARIEWFNRNYEAGERSVPGLTCPSARMPSWHTLLSVSPPSEILVEALNLLKFVLGETANWLMLPGDPPVFRFVPAMMFEIEPGSHGSSHVTMELFTLVEVLHKYLELPKPHPEFFILPIVRWWQKSMAPAVIDRARIRAFEQGGQWLTKQLGLLDLAMVEAVEVDGEPVASRVPLSTLSHADGHPRRVFLRVRDRGQDEIFAGPRTLAKKATGGLLIAAVAKSELDGDERSPLRGILLFMGKLAYALQDAARLSDSELALLLTGRDTPVTRAQALRALEIGRSLAVWWGGRWVSLLDAEVGPLGPMDGRVHRLGAPQWWHSKRSVGVPLAWRLVGGLWRLRATGTARGGIDMQRDALQRTLDGIEAALIWADRRPVRLGGPGPDTFIPRWHALRLSGEPVAEDIPIGGTAGRRYRRRAAALEAAGYVVPNGATVAPAGDTVEIVRIVLGNNRRFPGPGLVVRLSARYCEACLRTDPALARQTGTERAEEVWSLLQLSSLLPRG